MVNKFENVILTLNKFAWIVALVLGIVWLIEAIVAAAAIGTICGLAGGLGYALCAAAYTGPAVWWFIACGLAIVSGILGKMKVVGPINDKKFDEIWKMLLIVGIIGCIANGAGALFIVQAILIKVGGK